MEGNHYLLNSYCVLDTLRALSCYHNFTDEETEVREAKYIALVCGRNRICTQVSLFDSKPELFPLDKATQVRTSFS